GRTVCPLPEYEGRLDDALGDNRSYSQLSCRLTLSPSPETRSSPVKPITRTKVRSSPAVEQSSLNTNRGCSVTFEGHVGDGSERLAEAWATDVLLATLRWENGCVKPLHAFMV
ncbi:hypothetical protein Gpo141_00006939, partial [Globisporangium polare]